jgi:endonuclease/exonuclease/phosphatase family metal-dependent hydrolase
MRPVLLSLCMVACTPDKEPGEGAVDWGDSGLAADDAPAPDLRLATFNIQWLTADPLYETRRNDVDHEMIRSLITEHDLHLLALQEVEGEAGMAHLDLPSRWSWTAGETGWSQNQIVLWRNDLVEVEEVFELDLPATVNPSKEPLVARVRTRQGDLSLTLIGVHSKPFTDDENAAYRYEQIRELADWIEDELPDRFSGDYTENIAILGDFNDTFEGLNADWKSLDIIEQDLGYSLTTRTATTYTQVPYESLIDHIALSPGLTERWTEAGQEGGAHVIAHDELSPWSDYTGGYRDQQNISDHRPVWLDLEVSR